MNPQELGRQVLKRRKEMRLSQTDLANQAGISRNYISLIERGEARNVSMKVIGQLALALGAVTTELLQESDEVTLISPVLRGLALSEGLEYWVVDRLSRIPRRGQEPKTEDEWHQLYNAVREYLEEDE